MIARIRIRYPFVIWHGSMMYVKQLQRGTKITLYLKKDQLEYLETRRLKDLIKKHSEFISFPISLMVEKTEEREIEDEDAGQAAEPKETKSDGEGAKEPPKKKRKETVTKREWELLNTQKPIWTRKPEEIKKEEYGAFYKVCL